MGNAKDRLLMAGLFALCLLLRLLWLAVPPLAHDEPFTVYWAMQPLGRLMGLFASENNPPLHFLLMHAWVRFVPESAFWLRFPSAVMSALSLLPLYLLGLSLAGRRVAVTVALLFAASALHQAFAMEARAYALLTLLTITAFWCLRRAALGARHATLHLAAVCILVVYTHFMAWPVLALLLAVVWLAPGWRPAARSLYRALAATAIAFLPYAGIFLSRAGTSIAQGTWLEAPDLEEPYNMLWRWSNAPVVVVAFLVAIAGAAWHRKDMRATMAMPALWAFVPLIGLFVLSFAVPLYLDRYLLFAAPGYLLLVALAAEAMLPAGRWRFVPHAVALALMASTFRPYPAQLPQPGQVATAVQEARQAQPGLPVYVSPHWYRLTYLWHADRQQFKDLLPEEVYGPLLHPPLDGSAADDAGGAWVLMVGDVHPDGEGVPERFRGNEPMEEVVPDRGVWLGRFATP